MVDQLMDTWFVSFTEQREALTILIALKQKRFLLNYLCRFPLSRFSGCGVSTCCLCCV